MTEEVRDAHQLGGPDIIACGDIAGGDGDSGVERLREIDGVDFEAEH